MANCLSTLESNLVLVQNVSKLYRLYRRPSDRLRELLPGSQALHSDFWALSDISFSVEKGETLSLVGPNGCGKSTLLQIVAGILQPTKGRSSPPFPRSAHHRLTTPRGLQGGLIPQPLRQEKGNRQPGRSIPRAFKPSGQLDLSRRRRHGDA